MQDLSVTQEFLLCALNEKGKISGFNTEKIVCFVASGLLELQMQQCIHMDTKKITITGDLPLQCPYLKPLYSFLKEHNPVKINKVLEAYTFNFAVTNKQFHELITAIGDTLEDAGYVMSSQSGLFGNQKSYVPGKDAIHPIIDKIRAELLEEGPITENVAALVILLDKSKILKTYFSAYEQKELQSKLRKIVSEPMGKQVKEMVAYIETLITCVAVFGACGG